MSADLIDENAETDANENILVSLILEGKVAEFKFAYQDGRSIYISTKYIPSTLDSYFLHSARHGIIDLVIFLNVKGCDIQEQHPTSNKTALIYAAEFGHLNIINFLVNEGAFIDQTDIGGFTALNWAAYNGHDAACSALLDAGADVNHKTENNCTSLIWASGRGHEEVVQVLLAAGGCLIDECDRFGTPAVLWALRKGHLSIVKRLLEKGANVDCVGMYNFSAIHFAIKSGCVDCLLLMLQLSTRNIDSKDENCVTPLIMAIKAENIEFIRHLIEYDASLSVADYKGDSPLINAAKVDNVEMIALLLREGKPDVNYQGNIGKTALMIAIEKDNVNVFRELLKYSPDIELKDEKGQTALLKAVWNKNSLAVELLISAGATVGACDNDKNNALHVALRNRSKRIVHILLRDPRHNAFLFVPNSKGEIAYNIDRRTGKPLLGQIFGTSGLNTFHVEDGLIGYELYSQSLAVMLSEPTLKTPITIGLFARWGSGKSFVIEELRDTLHCYSTHQNACIRPRFLTVKHILIMLIAISFLSIFPAVLAQSAIVGAIIAASLTLISIAALTSIHFSYKNLEHPLARRLALTFSTFRDQVSLLLKITFCNAFRDNQIASFRLPKFLFFNCERFFMKASTNLIAHTLDQVFDLFEKDVGFLTATLLYRFQPSRQRGKFKTFCCVPYFVYLILWYAIFFVSLLLFSIYGAPWNMKKSDNESLMIVSSIFFALAMIGVLALLIVLTTLLITFISHRLRRTFSTTSRKVEDIDRFYRSEVAKLSMFSKIIDEFSLNFTRFIIVLDQLDNYNQENVVSCLDKMHTYFAAGGLDNPFIVIFAIDPHIIIKHLDTQMKANVYTGSDLSGIDYLRNLVHLPIFLQAQQKIPFQHTAAAPISSGSRGEADRKSTSGISSTRRSVRQSTKRLQRASSTEHIHDDEAMIPFINTNTTDLSKLLSYSSDYFSDINPRLLTRLRNVTAFMARLLIASNEAFSWLHLAAWSNLIEQWPFHLSYMLYYMEQNPVLDRNTSLNVIYEEIAERMHKDDKLSLLDRSGDKLKAALSSRKPHLTISDVEKFLPYSVNLDPFLRKTIRDFNRELETNVTQPFADLIERDLGEYSAAAIADLVRSNNDVLRLSDAEKCAKSLIENNINGFVLQLCELSDLKDVLGLVFGDWQIFASFVKSLRAVRDLAARTMQHSISGAPATATTATTLKIDSPAMSYRSEGTKQRQLKNIKEDEQSLSTISLAGSFTGSPLDEVVDAIIQPHSYVSSPVSVQAQATIDENEKLFSHIRFGPPTDFNVNFNNDNPSDESLLVVQPTPGSEAEPATNSDHTESEDNVSGLLMAPPPENTIEVVEIVSNDCADAADESAKAVVDSLKH